MLDNEKLVRVHTAAKQAPFTGRQAGEQQRNQASKLQIQAVLAGKSASRNEDAVHQAPDTEPKTRFGATTAGLRRANTLPDAVKQLTELTAGHPLIKETSPKPLPEKYTKGKKKSKPDSITGNNQNRKPDRRTSQWEKEEKKKLTKQYVELKFEDIFERFFGVSAITIAIVLNLNSAKNILLQSETYGIYNPESDEDNAQAAILADILAFLGIWDYWLEEKSQGRADDYIFHDRITEDTINTLPAPQSEEDKLATFCALVGVDLIDTLVKQTNVIDQQRRKLLAIISARSPMTNTLLEEKINSRRS